MSRSAQKFSGASSSKGPFSASRKAVDPVGFDPKTGKLNWPIVRSTPGLLASATHAGVKEGSGLRHAAIGLMATFGEVVMAIPQSYREVLRTPFREIANLAAKWVGARQHVDSLTSHKAKGTFPPPILGLHFPSLELTSEFKAVPTVRDSLSSLKDTFDTYRLSVLDEHIKICEKQVKYLDDELTPENLLPPLTDVLDAHKEELNKFNIVPPVNAMAVDGQGNLAEWVVSPAFNREMSHLKLDLPILVARVISIEKERYFAEKAKRAAKDKLKTSAEVEMGDMPTSTKAIHDIIKKELSTSLKKLKLVSHQSDSTFLISDSSLLGKRSRTEGRWQEEREEGWQRAKRQQGPENKIWGLRQEVPSFWEILGPTTQAWRHQSQEEQREAEGVVATATFDFDKPASYPDEVLLLPYSLAIRYLLRAASPSVIESARFRGGVHLGPGVFCPENICINISAGLKYLPQSQFDSDLILSAYDDFCDRLRWKISWITQAAENQSLGLELDNRPYDPDYTINKNRAAADPAANYIERGLDAGRAYCIKFMQSVEPGLRPSKPVPELVRVKDVITFLKDNDYLVLPTDKNLGSCVVTRQWFIDMTNKIFSDPANYKRISYEELVKILEIQILKVEDMAHLAEGQCNNRQLAAFLRQHAHVDKRSIERLPTFYGIPKIHKVPTKMRPIVPCHSAIQNPAAKYISKSLKPVLENRPFVLKGTKDLAIRFSKANFSTTRKKFLVSFDVEAFYPTIPVNDAIREVSKLWKWETQPSLSEQAMFKMGIELACKNLVCQFDKEYYLQAQGLAMGVSSSPDISNIWASTFEEVFIPKSQESEPDRLGFYGRFIDDGFMIVYATSVEDALSFAKRLVHIADHTLTWEASEYSLNFLDMTVYIDPVSGRVEHRPFRKARSHLERIPFVSHHPFDVRKGTFLGEMSRMAVLSSTPENYVHALEDLQSIYIARGYPKDLVIKWTKDNITKRWINRLRVTEDQNDRAKVNSTGVDENNLLILKTVFNPVWDSFNIHKLSNVVVNHWLSSLENWGWYNKQLYEHATAHYPTLTHEITWTEAKNIAKKDGFVPRDPAEDVDLSALASKAPSQPAPMVTNPKLPAWEDISFETLRFMGYHVQSQEVVRMLDVRKVGLTTARWMLSRKKVRNFGDILSTIKRDLLTDKVAGKQRQTDVVTVDTLEDLRSPSPFLDDDVAQYDAFEYQIPMDAI